MLGVILAVIQIVLFIGAAVLILLIWKDLRAIPAGYSYAGGYSSGYEDDYDQSYKQEDEPYEYEYQENVPQQQSEYNQRQQHSMVQQEYREEYEDDEELYLDDVYEDEEYAGEKEELIIPRGNRSALFDIGEKDEPGPFKLKF